MVHKLTNEVSISVEVFYQSEKSRPFWGEYFYAYRITINNLRKSSIRLLRRHWIIKDSNTTVREVEGEGVVGQMPIIAPGESFQYISSCIMNTDLGTMIGTYQMENMYDKTKFEVNVPEFKLSAPFKNN
jgi:ApaG protein